VQTVIERAIAKGCSVSPSVCHTRDAHLNGSDIEIYFTPYDRAMFLVS